MRIGLITDIHLAPPGHPAAAFHNPYAFVDAAERFQRALEHCILAGADVVAILGDVSHPGDDATLSQGVDSAAVAGRPIWLVTGNHDVSLSNDALAQAIARLNAEHIRMATPGGEEIAGGFRIAGLALAEGSVADEPRAGDLDTIDWRSDAVILLSHYPLVSLREQADAAGVKYAGDLDGRERVAAPLLARVHPTIVLHGHIHLGHVAAYGQLLQVSLPALIEPPFAVTLLDLNREGEQLTVRLRESSVMPASDVQAPRLSAPNQTWRFADAVWSSEGG